MMVMVTSVLCHSSVQLEPLSVVLLNTRLAAQKINSVRTASVLFLRRPALLVLLSAVLKKMSSAAVKLTKIASKKFMVTKRSTSASASQSSQPAVIFAVLLERSALTVLALFPRRPALLVLSSVVPKKMNSAAVRLTKSASKKHTATTRSTSVSASLNSLPAAIFAVLLMKNALMVSAVSLRCSSVPLARLSAVL